MIKRLSLKENTLAASLLVGFVLGVVGWFGVSFWPEHDPWKSAAVLGVMTAVAVMGLTLQLTMDSRFNRQVGLLTLLLGSTFALVSLWLMFQLPDSAASNSGGHVLVASWSCCAVLLAYILIPFVQAWPSRQQGRYRYTDLYRYSWDNFFILLVAAMLTLAYWLLMVLWVMLFKMVGIRLFETLFFNAVFPCLSLPVVFSLGIRLAREHEKIIGALRNIALSLCFFLMPLTAVITLLFGASLPFTGLQPIWDTGYSTPILLCLIAVNLLLVNGIFQDGAQQPYRSGLSRLTQAAMVVLPVYAVIGVYSVSLRIDQYGMTPNRFFLLVLVVVASAYSLLYAAAALWRSRMWMGLIRQGNILIALLICVLILLMHSPVLNPLAWSARDQINRLLAQKISPEDFDFGALKFHFGLPGLACLHQLNDLPPEHPLMPVLQTRLAAVDAAENYYQWKNDQPGEALADHPLVVSVDDKTPVPEAFLRILPERYCRKSTCYVLPVDLDGDTVDELLLFEMDNRWQALELYDRDDAGCWVKQGTVGPSMSTEQRQALVERIRQSGHGVIMPHYQSLKVGEDVYLFER